MTMEDKANAKAILTDKVLRGSLRVPDHGLEEYLANGKSGSFARSQKETNGRDAHPPTFFENDMDKWKERF
jgi:hypothetical protein